MMAINGKSNGQFRDAMKDIVRKHHRFIAFRAAAKFAAVYLKAYHNENHYRFEHNGEEFSLQTCKNLSKNKPQVMLDIGANVGDWTFKALEGNGNTQVHCFEIAPPTFETLQKRLESEDNVFLNAIGLSDKDEELNLNFVPSAHSTSSLYEPELSKNWGFSTQEIVVNLTTGDEYCRQRNISSIDFLKVDVEGHDYRVLLGFKDMLSEGNVRMIQFEHGFVHIASRTFLKDFYDFLGPLGYEIGRLHPHCVEFKDYDHCEDEKFRMGNYIAISKDDGELRGALSG